MRKLQLLIITLITYSALFSQSVITSCTLEGLPGDGTVRKQLLSAQTGNTASRIQTANITWVADATNPPPSNYTAVLNEACRIWGERINSNIPIKFGVKYIYMSGSPAQITLATTSTVVHQGDYLPAGKATYPIALYDKLSNTNILSEYTDFDITINSYASFFTGLNGAGITGSQYDLLSVILHEMGHGLGFITAMSYKNPYYGLGAGDYKASPMDKYMEDFSGSTKMINLPGNTQDFNSFVFGSGAFFKGSNALARNYSIPPKIWASNSSYGPNAVMNHLDGNVFFNGNNCVMAPGWSQGVVGHDIGNATLGMLQDIGWDVNYITYNIDLQIGRMNGNTFTTTGLTANFCEGFSGYAVAVRPTQNNGSTVSIPNGNVKWNLYAYHIGGAEDVLNTTVTGNVNTNTALTLKSQFPARTWIRNTDGSILGELRATATGSDGNMYTTSMRVSITQKPETPVVSSYCCQGKLYVNYAAVNATSYELYRNNILIYSGPNASFSFTPVRGLSYSFYAKAVYCGTANTSASITKTCWDCNGVWCTPKNECPSYSSRTASPDNASPDSQKDIPFYTTLAGGHLHIGVPAAMGNSAALRLSIISMDGKIIYSNHLTEQDIDVNSFCKGMYIVHITEDNTQLYENKIVIE